MAKAPRTPRLTGSSVNRSGAAGGGRKAVPHEAIPNTNPYQNGTTAFGGGPAPVMTPDMSWHAVGTTGLRQFSGWVREEFLFQLQGRQAARVYREMLNNSPIVGAIIFAITQSMRKVEWRIQEANDSPEAMKAREFVESLMDDMRHPWDAFIDEALSMLGYGFAPFEIVYKKRQGYRPDRDAVASSKYDDGLIGIADLPIRGQDTVLKWFFNDDGRVLGFTQQPYIGSLVDIPIEKLLIFRPGAHKGNPEGYSVLRNSYISYYYIKRMQEQEAILYERMSGFPLIRVPNAILEAANAGDTQAIQSLNAYQQWVTNVKIDEQMGGILPSDMWPGMNGPSNEKMFDFEFVVPQGGDKGAGFDTAIERNKLDILYTVLADFIQMGHSSRGAQSLAITKVDMFFQAIEGWLNSIGSVLNRHLLPRLWRLNAFDEATMPTFEPDLAQRVDLDSLGNLILHLAQAGMPLFPDDDLENWIRDASGLPDKSEESYYATSNIDPNGDTLAGDGDAGAAARDAQGAMVQNAVQPAPDEADTTLPNGGKPQPKGTSTAQQQAKILKLLGVQTPRQKRMLARKVGRAQGIY